MDLIERLDKYIWKIPKSGKMKVDGIIFTDVKSIKNPDLMEALKQVVNVATLPGIVKASFAMPDIHWGYGFPIGGVAAFDSEDGIISPGGVGFDINCGVRLLSTELKYEDIKEKLEIVAKKIYENVPVGVGSTGKLKLKKKDFKALCRMGAGWAVEKGYGFEEDLERIEDHGCIEYADPNLISEKAFERGKDEVGTLGAGNHFIEVQLVERIFNEDLAKIFGMEVGSITVMIHTGSRGFGHQIATDYISLMKKELKDFNRDVPDSQLISAPFKSLIGQDYFSAMACAANYAFANRQIITHIIRKVFEELFSGVSKVSVMYDVAHNIAKLEEHEYNGKKMKLVVHRKGATRAFGPGNLDVPEVYRSIGQPVIIPGDMGTASYLLVGTKKAEEMTFGTTAHGAGRLKGRRQALKSLNYNQVIEELKKKDIIVLSRSKKTLIEEAPEVYKNVDDVVEIVSQVGLSKKVARLVPLAVIKG